MEIEFYGAADRVTGSCHILHVNGYSVLFDCGMIQGSRKARALNHEAFPFDPKTIDAVVLSHAHIDHSGRLPLLVRRGYRGKIFAHNATYDLSKVMLKDAAHIQEEDNRNENRWRELNNKPLVELLYGAEDAKRALDHFDGLMYFEKREILPGVEVQFRDAGHILGSCIVEVWLTEGDLKKKFVFSGDLGQYDSPILNDLATIPDADLVLVESTYGNRLHRDRAETIKEIGEIIQMASKEGGNILIPAFAVGRSQEIIYHLGTHFDEWQLQKWKIFLNSPMAIEASKIYWDYPHLYDEETTRLRRHINEMPPLPNLKFTRTPDQSKAINKVHDHAIIIAGSGMMSGGRILHHLKFNIGDPKAHLVIVGYQGHGTLGRRLVDGAEEIRIHRKTFPVKATIHTVGGLSAHADQTDLLRWLGGFESKPHIAIIHGEDDASEMLAEKVEADLGFTTEIPRIGDRIDLAQL